MVCAWLSLAMVAAALLAPLDRSNVQAADELQLTVRRNFGFRAGSRIQGQFTLGVDQATDLDRVQFLIDGQIVGEAAGPPFEFRFHTGDYSLGTHQLAAIGKTRSGTELRTAARSFEFVSAEDSWQAAGKIAVPLVIVLVVMIGAGTLGPVLIGRQRKFVPGVNGAAGGAVCPRCRKPYSRSLLSPRLIVGKLERCPHCGKWAVVRRASASELETAEQLLQSESGRTAAVPSDDLQRMIEESRFES